MNPIRAQRTWNALASKWISAVPFGRGTPLRNSRRKQAGGIKKGVLTNFIPVEVVNAITGEVAKGYMRDLSIRRLRKWLSYHNYRAQVEQVFFSNKNTLHHLSPKEIENFPILVKLGKYQVPYLISSTRSSLIVRGRQTITLDLSAVDNLKYLETVADRKSMMMSLLNKIKRTKKRKKAKNKR